MNRELETVGKALDTMSWETLSDSHPALAEAIQHEVELGTKPEEIRRYVLRRTRHQGLASWCEQAARGRALSLGAPAQAN